MLTSDLERNSALLNQDFESIKKLTEVASVMKKIDKGDLIMDPNNAVHQDVQTLRNNFVSTIFLHKLIVKISLLK